VTYAVILRHSKPGIDSVLKRLESGESAAAILRADSVAGFVSGSIRSLREDDLQPLHKLLYEEMKPGQTHVMGPDNVGDYVVIQNVSHEPSRPLSFEEAQNEVDQAVQSLEAERLLKLFLARQRQGHAIEAHPELLMRVKLVNPRTSG